MANVVAEANRLGEVLVETEGPGHCSTHLVHVDGVGHPRHVVVTIWVEEHLGLVLEPTERLAVDDPVPITLEGGAKLIRLLSMLSTLRLVRLGSSRGEQLVF
jgi:hypothetical protein